MIINNNKEVNVVAVDFDGTLFTEDRFPEVGEPIYSNINFVKSLKSEGVQLILWTCREGDILEDAVEACKSVGIEFDAINQNLQWRIDKYGNDCRKVGADLYLDDKSMNPLLEEIMSRKRVDRISVDKCPHCGSPVDLTFKIPVYGAGGCEIKCSMCNAKMNDYNYTESHFDEERRTLSTPATLDSIIKCIERAVTRWNRRVNDRHE